MIDHYAELVNEFNQYKNVALPNNELRAKLLAEEVEEFRTAQTDIERQDAILDILYVAFGAIKENDWRGMTRKFYEVHRSNMSKMENGEFIRNADGKIIKGKDYRAPNLEEPAQINKDEAAKMLLSVSKELPDNYAGIAYVLRSIYINYLQDMLELDPVQFTDLHIKLNQIESELGL